jgi:hypothetical protein
LDFRNPEPRKAQSGRQGRHFFCYDGEGGLHGSDVLVDVGRTVGVGDEEGAGGDDPPPRE